MFENIEQLEREVQEFRKNILASSDLVACFERMIERIKEQNKTLETVSGNLQGNIKDQTKELQKQIAECLQKQADLIAEQSRNVESAAKELEGVIRQKTDEFGLRSDETLAAQVEKLTATNQVQVHNALDAMEKTNREFAAKCDEASKSFVTIQENLNARYEQVLTKLEAANVSETVRLSKSILKSINVKFVILLAGTAASLAIAIYSFIR